MPGAYNELLYEEHSEREGWWITELESLGIKTKRKNELNDLSELKALAENLKQTLFQDYKTIYGEGRKNDEDDNDGSDRHRNSNNNGLSSEYLVTA